MPIKTSSKPFEVLAIDSKRNYKKITRIKLTMLYLVIILLFMIISNIYLYYDFPKFIGKEDHIPVYEIAQTQKAIRMAIIQIDSNDIVLFISLSFLSYLLSGAALNFMQKGINRQKQFIAETSHELRTPLTIMKTNIEVALRGKPSKEEAETLASTLEEIDRLTQIVEDMLFLSQSDEGVARYRFMPANLRQCLEHVTRVASIYARQKQIELSCEDEKASPIMADSQKLNQALLNIVKNAIDYTRPHGKVTIKTHKSARTVKILIKDSGIGIDKKDLPYLFDRFYRSESGRRYKKEGSGLGLTIAKSIIDHHHGTIGIASQPNKGTTITITLPTENKKLPPWNRHRNGS